MKTSVEEISILKKLHGDNFTYPKFSARQESRLNLKIVHIRNFAKDHPFVHLCMQALPFIILMLSWVFLFFYLPKFIDNKLILFSLISFIHGIIGYQWVVYGMHEGAAHGLFRNKNSKIQRILNKLAFHSCRLKLADPIFYKKAHKTHHRYTGTIKDQAQTNYVHNKRVLISLLPGAGILFPNDYKIHKGDELTKSQILSTFIGGLFLALEVYLLRDVFAWYISLMSLGIIGPWVGLSLDRIRESIEHHLMPTDKIYASKELGVSPLALFLAGGPWGQPCHFCHHLAQDLNWYQQIYLHFEVKKIMNKQQKDFYGFGRSSVFSLIINNIKSRLYITKNIKPDLV